MPLTAALSHSQLNAAKAADHLDPYSAISQELLLVLRETCENMMVVPKSCKISTPDFDKGKSSMTVGRVRFERMAWIDDIVATKVRVCAATLPDHRHQRMPQRMICKEVVKLKRLNHQNIVPILGFDIDKLQLALDWTPGELYLPEYIKKNPRANRMNLVCVHSVVFSLCSDLPPDIRRCGGAPIPPFPRCD